MDQQTFREKAIELFDLILRFHNEGGCTLPKLLAYWGKAYNPIASGNNTVASQTMNILRSENIIKKDEMFPTEYDRVVLFVPLVDKDRFNFWLASYTFKNEKRREHRYHKRYKLEDKHTIFDQIMQAKGWNQAKLAKVLGVHCTSISKVRHGKKNISPYFQKKIDAFLQGNPISQGFGKGNQIVVPETPATLTNNNSDQPSLTGSSEGDRMLNSIIVAINVYLGIKRKQMESEIDTVLGEHKYYKALSERLAKELEEEKAKKETKKFLGFTW